MNDLPSIEEVFRKHQPSLAKIPGVARVGIGEKQGKKLIIVFVDNISESALAEIPKKLGGYDVEIRPALTLG